MKLNIIHVGLGRTSKTSLQQNVYPQLCQKINFNYCGEYISKNKHENILNDLLDKIIQHITKMQLGFNAEKINIPENTLICHEGLLGFDPFFWEEFSNKNLEAFGSLNHILITIREPRSFLTSVYLQNCYSTGQIQKPEYFFLRNNQYSPRLPAPKFAIEMFDYQKLIDLYVKKFKKVTIIKYENINNLSFIKNIFEINDYDYKELVKKFNNEIHNKAYNKSSIKYLNFINSFLNKFNLSLGKGITNEKIDYLNAFQKKSYNYKKQNIIKRIIHNIHKELLWQNLIHLRLGKLFKNEKFVLDFDYLSYIEIDKFDSLYKNIKEETILN